MTSTRHPLVSPNEGKAVDDWPIASDAEIASALQRVAAAARVLSFDHAMRRQKLQAIEAGLSAARDDFVQLIVKEVGKTPSEANSEVDYALTFLRTSLDLLSSFEFETELSTQRRITQVPYGPTVLITPFNDPLAGIVRKLAPAIAAGAPVLIKPSPKGCATALRLARVIRESDAEDVAIVLAIVAPAAIGALIRDDSVAMVSFTGSSQVGLEVAVAAARSGKHCVTELGGNNPFFIFADANIDMALADFFSRKLRAAGQACSSVNRLYVEWPIREAVIDRIRARLKTVRLGRSDSEPDLAPVISVEAVERLAGLARKAVAEGGVPLSSGRNPADGQGAFLFPLTIVETPAPGILDREEAFGPLVSISAFDDAEALVDRLSRERHMLAAYGYTSEAAPVSALLRRLPVGSIGINTTGIQGADFPTGGFGRSGRGREGGVWGFREFLTTCNSVQI